MFEKLIKWIKKKDKEKFAVWILKGIIAIVLKEYHLSRNPVRKGKEEGINNEQK